MTQAPKLESISLQKILTVINSTNKPVELKVEAEVGSEINDCVNIVDEKILQFGGLSVLGWQLWESPYLIEAEFHAVWQTPDGELKDITPKEGNIARILFLADERIQYTGRQINSIRINKINSELVDDLIQLRNLLFEFENFGKRQNLYDKDFEQSLNEIELSTWRRMSVLKMDICNLLDKGINEFSSCPCNKGKLFKNCHGAPIHADINSFNDFIQLQRLRFREA